MHEVTLPRFSREDVKKLPDDADKLLKDGDVIQSSEKFYKVAEEIIKTLAKEHAPEIYAQACEVGRWTVTLIEKAVRVLRKKFGDIIKVAWSDAWVLHTKGFHENLLDKEAVEMYAESVKKLFKEFEAWIQ